MGFSGRRRVLGSFVLACALLRPGAAAAQPASEAATGKALHALRTDQPLRIDGVLNEPIWGAAEAVSDFVQQEPRINEPVTEPTEVRVVFDNEALYFGITCRDGQKGGVIARERRRDDTFKDDDRFEIVLDTFHDHRNGYYFVINPLGTQYDALITDEGHDVNVEWDERWWSETRISDEGWTAEIKIPFTTLRSRAGADTFGVNFKRFIRRKNETAVWTAWDRDYQFLQVSQAGHLLGVQDIRTGLKLRVKPYALGGFREAPIGGRPGTDRISDVGIEVIKFSLTPSLTAELTANTDFAQTEVDEAVVNLTRFPLFFPEKREFFLERAGIFEFGLGGRRGNPNPTDRNLQMFFPRRIGLSEDRRAVPILAGAKLIGRTAGLDVGFLNLQTGRGAGQPTSNYTVFRAKRNVLARSNVGMFMSNRYASDANRNGVLGGDVNLTLFKNTDIQGFLGRSWTPGRRGNQYAGRAKYNWFTDQFEAFFEHLYVGPQFQHDVGFVRRRDIARSDAAFIWQPRPGVLNIRNFVFRNELIYTTDTHGLLSQRDQIFQFSTRFQNDDAVRANSTGLFDRLDQPFEIAPGVRLPPGDYQFRDNFVEVEGTGKRVIAGRVRYGHGSFYSGTRSYVALSPSFKPMPAMSLETTYEYNSIHLREGAFTTNVVNARANLNVSNKWLTTMLVQYDTASERHVLFLRLNYIFRPGDDLFIVFNRTSQTARAGDLVDRALMVKWTYSFDF